MGAELTVATFRRAALCQRPLAGLIHHRDRGVQYACGAFREQLQAHGVTASMSRPGDPYDNALAESFVATLKIECFGESIPPTKAAAKLLAIESIETFYNRCRRHSALGYESPAEFESKLFPSQKPLTSKPRQLTESPVHTFEESSAEDGRLHGRKMGAAGTGDALSRLDCR